MSQGSERAGAIYLDYNATTPLAPEVARSMIDVLKRSGDCGTVLDPETNFGNPSSSHVFGQKASKALSDARSHVARCINAKFPDEVVFTSGGTESVNHAIKGACLYHALRKDGAMKRNHIVTSCIEHCVVTETIEYLTKNFGFTCTTIPVNSFGVVDPQDVADAVTESTAIVSVMLANNEVGSIQPIAEIVRLSKTKNPDVLVHTDASQAVGKICVDVQDVGVDMLSIAGHKLYGPKGIGALYIKQSAGSKVEKFMHGASHESNRRAGTENVLLAIGLGVACNLFHEKCNEEVASMAFLRDRLQELLMEKCSALGVKCVVNGNQSSRLPNTLSIGFRGCIASDIVRKLQNKVACSAGAACHSSKTGSSSDDTVCISHVLKAMNVSSEYAIGTLRLSVGRFTTLADIEMGAQEIINSLKS